MSERKPAVGIVSWLDDYLVCFIDIDGVLDGGDVLGRFSTAERAKDYAAWLNSVPSPTPPVIPTFMEPLLGSLAELASVWKVLPKGTALPTPLWESILDVLSHLAELPAGEPLDGVRIGGERVPGADMTGVTVRGGQPPSRVAPDPEPGEDYRQYRHRLVNAFPPNDIRDAWDKAHGGAPKPPASESGVPRFEVVEGPDGGCSVMFNTSRCQDVIGSGLSRGIAEMLVSSFIESWKRDPDGTDRRAVEMAGEWARL